MSHTTQQQPDPAAVVTALRAMADRLARDIATRGELPITVAEDQMRTYVSFGSADRAMDVVAGMAGDVVYGESAGESYVTKTWRGSVAGWRLCVITTLYGRQQIDAPAGDEPATPHFRIDAAGNVSQLVELAAVDEHQDDDAAQLVTSADRLAAAWRATVDTSPATAAAEQPAGPVSGWPAVVPAQRPPAELLPTPSWALVGMDTAFPAEPVGVIRPLTDPALIGHDPTAPQDDEPAGQLVDLADVRAARVAAAADSEVTA